jgi:hypothetical protein
MRAEHERVLAERDRLAEAMERMAGPIVKIAHAVSRIEIRDREIGRLAATSTANFGHIRLVLSGAAPAIAALFQDALVWDVFIAVAGLKAPPVVSGWGKGEGPTASHAISRFASVGGRTIIRDVRSPALEILPRASRMPRERLAFSVPLGSA